MVALLGAGAKGNNLLPSAILKTHCWAAVGTSRVLTSSCFSEGGSSSAFDFSLHVRCPTSSRWPAAPRHPSPGRPCGRAGCPPEEREPSGLPRLTARLENKSRASRVHFRLFYRSHHPAQPCRAEPVLGRASLLQGQAGPAGHGTPSSPEQPWKSKAEQAQHRTGASTIPARQPPARTQPLPEQQTKLQRACAQQPSARAIAAQVAAAGKTTKPPRPRQKGRR